MICCFFYVKGQYSLPPAVSKHAAADQSHRPPNPVRLPASWLPYKYMQGKSVTQQAPPTGRREASHGGRRPSLIAKDDLPVATSDCSWRHGNREQQVAAPPGKSFGLTECLLRYPMSGLLLFDLTRRIMATLSTYSSLA